MADATIEEPVQFFYSWEDIGSFPEVVGEDWKLPWLPGLNVYKIT